MKYKFLIGCLMLSCAGWMMAQTDEPIFTKATDLYYGTEFSKQFNHQLWFTTDGLTYDAVQSIIEGEDGMIMELDLMCPSATDIVGTYEIVGPKDADAPYKMNKKYTYWTYMEKGGFLQRKLTEGTCTIVCTSRLTYTITYNVREIDNGPWHKGTIENITIPAVKSNGQSYKLVPTCKNELLPIESPTQDDKSTRLVLKNGIIYVQYTDVEGKLHTHTLL